MAELQEKSTVVVVKFSFKATEKRKKSEMVAKNSMNQERVIHCLFVFDSRVSSKPSWTKTFWLWGTKFHLVLI